MPRHSLPPAEPELLRRLGHPPMKGGAPMKELLAKKSGKYVRTMVFSSLALIILTLLSFLAFLWQAQEQERAREQASLPFDVPSSGSPALLGLVFLLLVLGISAAILTILTIRAVRAPQELLFADENGLYVRQQEAAERFIPFSRIEQVEQAPLHNRTAVFSYGALVLALSDGERLEISPLDDLDTLKTTIVERKTLCRLRAQIPASGGKDADSAME